jgi:hypothetical protein
VFFYFNQQGQRHFCITLYLEPSIELMKFQGLLCLVMAALSSIGPGRNLNFWALVSANHEYYLIRKIVKFRNKLHFVGKENRGYAACVKIQ